MIINVQNSMTSYDELCHGEVRRAHNYLPFSRKLLVDNFKYLGFHLKPKPYRKYDLMWLFVKVEKRLKHWSYKWLSREGILVLIKSALEEIPVYWMALKWIPKGILKSIIKIYRRLIWIGSKEEVDLPYVRWDKVALPKPWGGWFLKYLPIFAKGFLEKARWRLLST